MYNSKDFVIIILYNNEPCNIEQNKVWDLCKTIVFENLPAKIKIGDRIVSSKRKSEKVYKFFAVI